MNNFKIRASATKSIMTNPRSKSEKLSDTCKTYLEEWVKENIYGVRKNIKSKYLTKGISVEDEAIEYYSEIEKLGFVLKNQDRFEDDFFTGTPDLIVGDTVYDFKSSWDCFTFPLFDTEPDKSYWMQLQVYMELTGLRKAKLVYTLQNTPDELMFDEPMDYSNVPSHLRIKEFSFDYDPEFIELVKQRVLDCREHVSNNLQIKQP
jgi:hypothetical protein